MNTQDDVVKEWEERLREEGREQAQVAMIGVLHHILLLMYELRFGSMPDDAARARLRAVSDPEVLVRLSNLVAIEPQEIVDRALTDALS